MKKYQMLLIIFFTISIQYVICEGIFDYDNSFSLEKSNKYIARKYNELIVNVDLPLSKGNLSIPMYDSNGDIYELMQAIIIEVQNKYKVDFVYDRYSETYEIFKIPIEVENAAFKNNKDVVVFIRVDSTWRSTISICFHHYDKIQK